MSAAWSIQRRLPFLLVAVLVLAVATLAAASYAAVRAQALAAVEERLDRLAEPIAASFAAPAVRVQLERVASAASSQPVIDLLAGIEVDEGAARVALRGALGEGADTIPIGLWSDAGSLLLEAVPGLHGPLAGSPPVVGNAAAISFLRALDDSTVFFDAVAPVRADGRTVGAVAVRRRLLASQSSAMQMILGPSGGLLIGNSDGGLWVDGPRVAAPPPPSVLGAEGLVSFERGGVEYVGVVTGGAPNPWVVLVEVGRAEALAPASAFLVMILLISAGLIALGAAAAWVLGRRLTGPLRALSEAVSGISAGDYSRRVSLVAPAEAAHLGSAVNSMAEQVQVRERELRHAEEELRLERGKLLAAFDNTAMGLVLSDEQGGDISMNAAALRFHGFRSTEDMHRRVEEYAGDWELRYPDNRIMPPEEWPLLRAVRGDYVRDYDADLRNVRTGHEWSCSFTTAPVRNSAGEVVRIVMTLMDITERKRAEEAERQHHERYRTLFDTLLEGFCIIEVLFDADDHPVDYRFLEINSAFEAQTGLRNAQGKRMRELAPDHDEHWFAVYGKIALTGEPARFVNEAKALGRWFDVSAYRVGGKDSRRVAILFNDISDIKRGEQKIQSQLEHLRLLDRITTSIGERLDPESIFQVVVRSIEDSLSLDFACVCVHDPETNALTLSAAGLKSEALAHGLTMDETVLIGAESNPLWRCMQGQLVYEPDLSDVRFPFSERLARGGLGSVVMAPLRSESRVFGVLLAARREAHAFSSLESEFLRQVSQHVGLASNQAQLYAALQQANAELEARVTERTHDLETTNEALRRNAADLQASNRELDAFAYSVSHDLRAPLRSIDGFSQVLLEDYAGDLDDAGRDSLRRVRAASQRMGSLIDDLLKLARISRVGMQTEVVDLSSLAHEIMADIQRSTPERQVEVSIAPGLQANGDRRLLRVALDNLLRNSWKYTSKQACARIELGSVQVDGKRAFIVRDNGAGFDMKYADKLFGEFQRLHAESEFEGTGVGLATVRRIVTRHGGSIWAEAAVGQGATFYFTL